jgi:tRNA(Arg) A34 adenosine deaminase TadA
MDGALCYTATIARKSGNVTSSKPCYACAVAMLSYGIETCIYTISSPGLVTHTMNLAEELDSLKVYAKANE